MARTTAFAEWSEEDEGFVVELEATELTAALHTDDGPAEADELVVRVSTTQAEALKRAV